MRCFLEKTFATLWRIVPGNLQLNIVPGPRGLTGEKKALDPGEWNSIEIQNPTELKSVEDAQATIQT